MQKFFSILFLLYYFFLYICRKFINNAFNWILIGCFCWLGGAGLAPHSLRIRSAFAPLNKKSFFRYSHLCSYTPPTDYVISNQKYTYEKIAFFCPLQGGRTNIFNTRKNQEENDKKIIINIKY